MTENDISPGRKAGAFLLNVEPPAFNLLLLLRKIRMIRRVWKFMFDPALAALTVIFVTGSITGVIWFVAIIWTGRYTGWVRDGFFSFGRFGTVERRSHPYSYTVGLFTAFVIATVCIGWTYELLPGLIEGKKLHSRFHDGTAIFDNEGISCTGDPPGFTHYHSCSGIPVPVPQ